MKEDLAMIRDLGFKGVVFGVLRPDGTVDTQAMSSLMKLAGPMEVTFHRAFDASRDPFESLASLSDLGVARILSSGMKATAEEGIALLKEMNERSKGPVIMAGSAVRPGNIRQFIDAGIKEVHSSAGKNFHSPMVYKNPDIYMGHSGQDEYIRFGVDIEAIAEMKRLIS